MTPTYIAVFGASKAAPGDGRYEEGVKCGRLLAEAGYGVVTGGYGGLMEAVSQGASEAGGHVVGITAPDVFRTRTGANRFVAEERRAAHLLERIHELTEVSSGAIVLPGSIGTMAELTAAWNLAFVARTGGSAPKPVITVGAPWNTITTDLAAALETDGDLVHRAPDVESAVAEIVRRVPSDS